MASFLPAIRNFNHLPFSCQKPLRPPQKILCTPFPPPPPPVVYRMNAALKGCLLVVVFLANFFKWCHHVSEKVPKRRRSGSSNLLSNLKILH